MRARGGLRGLARHAGVRGRPEAGAAARLRPLLDGGMTLESGGWLHVKGVEVSCTIGVTERERAAKQRVVIDVKLKVDFGRVAVSDAIQDTVDYRRVVARVVAE